MHVRAEFNRTPHPVRSLSEAMANRRAICEPRGYCGPFVNETYYAALGDPLWYGMAECVHCCSTVHVSTELERWERELWRRQFAVMLP